MNNPEFNEGVVKPADCISEGLEMIKSDYLLFVGMAFVAGLIGFAVGVIPLAGGIINAAVSGPIVCGIYFSMIRKYRREPVEFGMMFARFDRFIPASLVTLVGMVPWLAMGLGMEVLTTGLPGPELPELILKTPPDQQLTILTGLIVTFGIAYAAVMVISIGLQLLLFCALPMIAERDIPFGEAFSLSARAGLANWGGLLLLFILEGLMMIAGFFVLCIGLFFAIPLIYAANIVAYRKIFPEAGQGMSNEPPKPEYYRSTFGS